MLTLIFPISFIVLGVFEAKAIAAFGEKKSCQGSPVKAPSGKSTPCNLKFYQNSFLKSNAFYEEDILRLQESSMKNVETLLQNKEFQETVADLQEKIPFFTPSRETKGELLIFVSFSLGETALFNIATEAKRYGATLLLRGFKEGSYKKTVKALQKIITKTGQGFIIDPELYTLFSIQAVPTFILTKPFPLNAGERRQTPLHDRLMGHVSSHYALDTFAKDGDMKEAAQSLLERRKNR